MVYFDQKITDDNSSDGQRQPVRPLRRLSAAINERGMIMTNIEIRTATPDDAEDLLSIYGYYVIHTAISFEYEVPKVDEFRGRILRMQYG